MLVKVLVVLTLDGACCRSRPCCTTPLKAELLVVGAACVRKLLVCFTRRSEPVVLLLLVGCSRTELVKGVHELINVSKELEMALGPARIKTDRRQLGLNLVRLDVC